MKTPDSDAESGEKGDNVQNYTWHLAEQLIKYFIQQLVGVSDEMTNYCRRTRLAGSPLLSQ